MGNENLNADLIYEFWRWEYLRRNTQYQEHYNSIALYLNKRGVTGFRYFSVEDYKSSKISLLDCLETNEGFSTEYSLDILLKLFQSIITFKVFPILNPNIGIESVKLLEKILVNNDRKIFVNYNLLPKANWLPSLFSTAIKKDDIEPLSPLPEPISKANERFLAQNPYLNNLTNIINKFLDQIIASTDKNTFEKGKYQILSNALKTMVVKDKKIIIAEEKLIKQNGKMRDVVTAVRNKKRQWLNDNGKKIFQENSSRAVGLYLTDQKKLHGKKGKDLFDHFENLLSKFDQKYKTDDNIYNIPDHSTLHKFVRNADKCIQEIDLLPIP